MHVYIYTQIYIIHKYVCVVWLCVCWISLHVSGLSLCTCMFPYMCLYVCCISVNALQACFCVYGHVCLLCLHVYVFWFNHCTCMYMCIWYFCEGVSGVSVCVKITNTAFFEAWWVSLGPVSHCVQASICEMFPCP